MLAPTCMYRPIIHHLINAITPQAIKTETRPEDLPQLLFTTTQAYAGTRSLMRCQHSRPRRTRDGPTKRFVGHLIT